MKRPNKARALPTSLARHWVRYVVGFGVAVGIGLSPFLGKVAGLDALLGLYPQSLRGFLIPVSAFLMGIIAVTIQFFSGDRIAASKLRRRFSLAVTGLLVGLLLFVTCYSLLVVRVQYQRTPGVLETEPVLIAWSRTPSCKCLPTDTDIKCLQSISLEETAVASCWDSRLSGLTLSLFYFILTGGFGALVGLLVLAEEFARSGRQTKPRKA